MHSFASVLLIFCAGSEVSWFENRFCKIFPGTNLIAAQDELNKQKHRTGREVVGERLNS